MKSITRFKKNKKGLSCLNCKQPISDKDNFCSNCGQVNDTSPLSIQQYFSEYLSGFFSFDNRFLKTIYPLLFKPGKVSKEYTEGKRKKYANPFQLYLNITIFFFLIMGIFNTVDKYNVSSTETAADTLHLIENKASIDSIQSSTSSELKKNDPDREISKYVEEGLKSDNLDVSVSGNTGNYDSIIDPKNEKITHYIDSVFANSNYISQLKSTMLTNAEKDTIFKELFKDITNYSFTLQTGKEEIIIKDWQEITFINQLKITALNHLEKIFKENEIEYTIPNGYKTPLEDNILKKIFGEKFFTKMDDFLEYDENHKDAKSQVALEEMGYEKSYWNNFYYSKAQNLNKFKNDSQFRKSYADNIISKISVALFFLLPIFTLIVALLYIRNKHNYTEHLVFVFNVQTAFFIFLTFFILGNRLFDTDIGIPLFFLLFLFYLYKSLRNFYEQGRLKTWIKYLFLNVSFVILATIGGVIISFIAFLI